MINNILFFFTGIGVFLFGLTLLSNNAMNTGEKLFKYKLNRALGNSFFATGLGLSVTAIVQSSSATNSFAVNLADRGMIDKKASFYIIMGSNIGTTSTAYLAIIAKLNFSYVLASLIFFAVISLMLVKNKKIKNISMIVCCISLIFIGLMLVKDSITPFQSSLYSFMVSQKGSFSLFLFAMLLTAIFQSSSLTTVFLVSMATLNVVDLTSAMLMIMGINIGSCFTVFIATIGCSKIGWSVAFFHLLFNAVGIVLNLFLLKTGMLDFFFTMNCGVYIKIALFHTFFNVSTTLFLYYFIPELCSLLSFNKRKAKLRVIIL